MFGKNEPKETPDAQYFVIFDSKVGNYWEPRPATNHIELLRALDQRMKKKDNDDQLFTNAEDFQIFKIADYFKKNAKFVVHDPVHIANMHEIKAAALRTEVPGH